MSATQSINHNIYTLITLHMEMLLEQWRVRTARTLGTCATLMDQRACSRVLEAPNRPSAVSAAACDRALTLQQELNHLLLHVIVDSGCPLASCTTRRVERGICRDGDHRGDFCERHAQHLGWVREAYAAPLAHHAAAAFKRMPIRVC